MYKWNQVSQIINMRVVNIKKWLIAGLGWLSPCATAAEGPPVALRASASLTPAYLASAGIDGGGTYESRVLALNLSAKHPMNTHTTVGITFNYTYYENRFRDINAFSVAKPWGNIERMGLSIPVFIRSNTGWVYFLTPSMDFIHERDADWGDSLTYGAVLSASRYFGPKKRLGFGLGLFQQLEEVKVFPFPAVDWQLTDTLRVNNPLPAGPTGPAGLEINYRVNTNWELGIGSAYRRVRFRLTNNGPFPGGTGEENGVIAFLHAATQFGEDMSLDLYGGALLNGELQVEDSQGHNIARHNFDTAPLLGATLRMQF
jgi:hypothetical protein